MNLNMLRLGILVGRPTLTTTGFSYVVIPKKERPDEEIPDALETVLPVSIKDMYQVNAKRNVVLFKDLHVVRYVRKDEPSPTGRFILKAVIREVVKKIPLAEIEKRVTEIDDVTITEYSREPEIDEDFIRDLYRYGGAIIPKRVTATQVIFQVEKDGKVDHVMLSLPESFIYIQENPGILKSQIFLESYLLTILTTKETLSYDEFAEEVIDRIKYSIRAFENMRKNLLAMSSGVSEVEE